MASHEAPRKHFFGRKHLARTSVTLLSVGALVGGGVALASVPDAGTGLIHGCYSTSTGALRVIDVAKGQVCHTGEGKLNWNQRGLNWRGAWSSTITYAVNDVVVRSGSSYLALHSNKNIAPSNTTYWGVLAAAGAKGTTGATGATGATGPQGLQGTPGATTTITYVYGSLVSLAPGQSGTATAQCPAGSYAVAGSFSNPGHLKFMWSSLDVSSTTGAPDGAWDVVADNDTASTGSFRTIASCVSGTLAP